MTKKVTEKMNTAEIEEILVQAAEDKAKTDSNRENQLVYIGADLPGLKSNTTLTSGIPTQYNKDFIRELFVPVEKFAEAIKRKNVTTSRIAYCYRKSAEYANNLRK